MHEWLTGLTKGYLQWGIILFCLLGAVAVVFYNVIEKLLNERFTYLNDQLVVIHNTLREILDELRERSLSD
jgi:hypothetical protein